MSAHKAINTRDPRQEILVESIPPDGLFLVLTGSKVPAWLLTTNFLPMLLLCLANPGEKTTAK